MVNGILYAYVGKGNGEIGTPSDGWSNLGGIVGPTGPDGKSAFEVWQGVTGNSGKTEDEYFEAIKGPIGPTGPDGLINKKVYYKEYGQKSDLIYLIGKFIEEEPTGGFQPEYNLGYDEDNPDDNQYGVKLGFSNIYIDPYDESMHGKAYYVDSDERLKNILGNIDIDVSKLLSLSLVYFTFKSDENNERKIGVIAQEIQKICPEIVSMNSEGYLSVDYAKLAVLALYVAKKNNDRINKLEEKIL